MPELAEKISVLAEAKKSDALAQRVSFLVWSCNDYFNATCHYQEMAPAALAACHEALVSSLKSLRAISNLVCLAMISPEGYEKCFGPQPRPQYTQAIRERLESAWIVAKAQEGVYVVPLDPLFLDHERSCGKPFGWHLKDTAVNHEFSCEYFGNMFRAAVRLSILKKV